MAETPDRVRRLIRGLTEKQLETKPAPGKWCIKEIVAHLADGEVILGSRYRFIAAHDRPPLPGYDQDAFVERLGPMNAKAADLADDFAMARAVNLGLLERLPEDAWDRVGLHAERGEESIRSHRGDVRGPRSHPPRPDRDDPDGALPESREEAPGAKAAKTARKKAARGADHARVRRAAQRASGAAAGATRRERRRRRRRSGRHGRRGTGARDLRWRLRCAALALPRRGAREEAGIGPAAASPVRSASAIPVPV